MGPCWRIREMLSCIEQCPLCLNAFTLFIYLKPQEKSICWMTISAYIKLSGGFLPAGVREGVVT